MHVHEAQQDEAGSTQQPTFEHQHQATSVNTKEEDPNLIDILEEEVSDIGEEDQVDDEPIDLTSIDDLAG